MGVPSALGGLSATRCSRSGADGLGVAAGLGSGCASLGDFFSGAGSPRSFLNRLRKRDFIRDMIVSILFLTLGIASSGFVHDTEFLVLSLRPQGFPTLLCKLCSLTDKYPFLPRSDKNPWGLRIPTGKPKPGFFTLAPILLDMTAFVTDFPVLD
jgi:hypothetical protein